MNLVQWSRSSLGYGRKLVNSGMAGAREGETEFLKETLISPYLNGCARHAMAPALLGACLGLAVGARGNGKRSAIRTLAFGVIGGAIGFGAGVAWENRRLTASVASGAWKNINKARDEHWLEKHPIDYA